MAVIVFKYLPLFLLLTSYSLSSFAEDISVAADPWCPYNCDPSTGHNGFMIDIASEALATEGYSLKYSLVNWARAKKMVQSGDLDSIVGMSKTEKSKALYVFPESKLGVSQICFFKRASDQFSYKGTQSLYEKKVGWIKDFGVANDQELDSWVKGNAENPSLLFLHGVDVRQRLIKMLQLGRIDTFPEDKLVVQFDLKTMGLESEVAVAGCTKSLDEVYIAFSPKNAKSPAMAQALDRGV